MNNYLFIDAVSYLDADLLAEHLERKEKLKRKVKSKKINILRWSGIAASFCALLFVISVVIQYIPSTYELDYSYTGSNGEDTYISNKSVWIYYAEDSGVKRERVNLPCSAENVFLTWKYLNDIDDDVTLISYEIKSNGVWDSSSFDGENVENYKPGNYYILNITISQNIKNYINDKDYDALITSLKRSMTEYSNIEFDEVNIMFE